jgi:hypothetical protein
MRHGFGLVDTEPSPPMRPEQAAYPKPDFSVAEIDTQATQTDDE